jgi:hypothetical protein
MSKNPGSPRIEKSPFPIAKRNQKTGDSARFLEASNWLFAGSRAGGERAAAIYSIIESCKLNGVEPFAHITDVMQKIVRVRPRPLVDAIFR